MSEPATTTASTETSAPPSVTDPIAWRWRLRASTAVLSVGLIFMAAAAWGAWVVHPSPGLTLLGIDLPEYVKFLPAVRSGQLALTREVFYWPLLVLAAGLSLLALITRGEWPRGLRTALALAGIPCALALLPPAWSPATFSQAEYRLQVVAIGVLLLFSAVTLLAVWWQDKSVPAARWLQVVAGGVFVVFALLAAIPLLAWQQIQPEVAIIYHQSLHLGWGGWALLVGALYLALGGILLVSRK
jgi:hypothetical protein